MNILLGITGSVAATLTTKIVERLTKLGNVRVMVTESAKNFYDHNSVLPFLQKQPGVSYPYILDDKGEWSHWHKKGDPIDHIDMRKWADVLVIAPLTANTLAKMANGICDNLLTCTVRAWDYRKPIVLAPAMNSNMWQHPLTMSHLNLIQSWGKRVEVVWPIKKVLACGDNGIGAMAKIEDIAIGIQKALRWSWPLSYANGLPFGNHPGAFSFRRKHDVHTGVDLYTYEGARVGAMERGTVVKIIPFTGEGVIVDGQKSTWWNNTSAVAVQGASGVIVYGEIEPDGILVKAGEGSTVEVGETIGTVVPVLPEGKDRHDIPGHSRSILHVELYTHLYEDKTRGIWESWELDKEKPERLLDPTVKLLECKPSNFPILQIP